MYICTMVLVLSKIKHYFSVLWTMKALRYKVFFYLLQTSVSIILWSKFKKLITIDSKI